VSNFGSSEFKVGLLVVGIATLIGGMSIKLAEGPGFMGGSNSYSFDVKDAGGLVPNSGVRMAGIKVGVIDRIELVDGKARVFLNLESGAPVKASSLIEVRADGILGDKHVEIMPGRIDDAVLEDGGQLNTSDTSSSLDDLMKKIGKVADNLNAATAGDGDSTTPLGRIVLNIEKLTKDLAEVSGKNKKKINEIITRVHNITGSLDRFLDEQNPKGFKPAWDRVSRSLENLDASMINVREITRKVNDGEGTIGRLVNDEETVENLNTAINNVNEFLGTASTLQLSLDYHSEYLFDAEETKSYIGVRIQPGLDRYYYVGVVDDPRGKIESSHQFTEPDGGTPSGVTTTTTYKNKLKFTALFAKNFYNFTVKGGIIESSGGVGVDYHLLDNDLLLSLEAFDFDDTHVRSFIKYNFFKGIYVIGGGDNVTNSELASFFVGGGLFLTNDDLKLLLSKISTN